MVGEATKLAMKRNQSLIASKNFSQSWMQERFGPYRSKAGRQGFSSSYERGASGRHPGFRWDLGTERKR